MIQEFRLQTDYIYPTVIPGNRVYNYKVGEGINDAELGFPLAYKNITNTGDIVFNFSLLKSLHMK